MFSFVLIVFKLYSFVCLVVCLLYLRRFYVMYLYSFVLVLIIVFFKIIIHVIMLTALLETILADSRLFNRD